MNDSDNLNAKAYIHPLPDSTIKAPPCFTSMMNIDFGALSHVGKVRKNNEDHYLIMRLGRVIEPLMTNVPAEDLPTNLAEYGYGMLVADGMGGHAAGEVASRMATTLLINLIVEAGKWGSRIDDKEAKAVMQRIEGYYNAIHTALLQQAESEPSLVGMGTTLTVSYSFCANHFIGNVGDSRAYLFREGGLNRLTRDHTLAQEMADRGEIAPEAVKSHRFRNILTNALGGHWGPVEIDIQQLLLKENDRILLCSDGLTDMIEDETITGVLNRTEDSNAACHELVDLALEAGGRDNITVVLARYSFPENTQDT